MTAKWERVRERFTGLYLRVIHYYKHQRAFIRVCRAEWTDDNGGEESSSDADHRRDDGGVGRRVGQRELRQRHVIGGEQQRDVIAVPPGGGAPSRDDDARRREADVGGRAAGPAAEDQQSRAEADARPQLGARRPARGDALRARAVGAQAVEDRDAAACQELHPDAEQLARRDEEAGERRVPTAPRGTGDGAGGPRRRRPGGRHRQAGPRLARHATRRNDDGDDGDDDRHGASGVDQSGAVRPARRQVDAVTMAARALLVRTVRCAGETVAASRLRTVSPDGRLHADDGHGQHAHGRQTHVTDTVKVNRQDRGARRYYQRHGLS